MTQQSARAADGGAEPRRGMAAVPGEVEGLQAAMAAAAQQQPLPRRFADRPAEPGSRRVITDTETGRSVAVPLFAYRAVREALHGLFGDEGA